MKTATIRCAHSSVKFQLEVEEKDTCYIQCQLIQLHLNREQTKLLCSHCSCMESQIWFGKEGEGFITIDPSQLDLNGKHAAVQPVG